MILSEALIHNQAKTDLRLSLARHHSHPPLTLMSKLRKISTKKTLVTCSVPGNVSAVSSGTSGRSAQEHVHTTGGFSENETEKINNIAKFNKQ